MNIKTFLLLAVLLAQTVLGQSGIVNPHVRTVNGIPATLNVWARWKASEVTGPDGTEVTLWNDISGNGRDLVVGNSPQTPNKRTSAGGLTGNTVALDFQLDGNAEYLKFSETPVISEAEIFFFVKRDADPGPFGGSLGYIGSGADDYYPYTDNNIYEAFGSTVRKTVNGAGLADLAQWRNYNVSSAAGEFIVRIDNIQVHSTSTNTVGFRPVPIIGKGGSDGVGGNPCDCLLAEVIVLSTRATAGERAAIDSYFRREYLGL